MLKLSHKIDTINSKIEKTESDQSILEDLIEKKESIVSNMIEYNYQYLDEINGHFNKEINKYISSVRYSFRCFNWLKT